MIELSIKLADESHENFIYIEVKLMFLGYYLIHTKVGLNQEMKNAEWSKSIDVVNYLANRVTKSE